MKNTESKGLLKSSYEEDTKMALSNLAEWNETSSACGASDKPEDEKPAACGVAGK